MGIQGLLPFLKKIHQPVNIADFQGCTVAIDAYCWLHKGAFSCAEKLAMGEKTDQYVHYCMKYVDYMLRKNLKPILVFDGCHLKSKADVERTRKQRREVHRKKAAQFLREGKRSEAKECLQRCVDITPQMALELMNACRTRGVDCIVAPYEADAQLAYLNLRGIAQVIVTEDSDLLLFGCEKIVFKMDFFGNGTLIEKARLNEVLTVQGGFYTFEKFRYMCILSGCDYLPSLPGIGLNKACKVVKMARQPDIRQLLTKLPTYLKMNLTVTEEYIEGFMRANNTFLYQLVYDPQRRHLCPLNPYLPELDRNDLDYAGEYFPEEKAYQIALGNVDIHNHQCIAFFDPETFVPKKAAKPKFRYQLSIWDKNYQIKSSSPCKESKQHSLEDEQQRPSTHGKARIVNVRLKPSQKSSGNHVALALQKSPDGKVDEELLSVYGEESENLYPEADRAKRNIMNSFADLCTYSEDIQDNFDRDFNNVIVMTSTPDKTTLSPDKTKQENISSDSDSESSREETERRGRKRKLSGTPSKRPTAADIGEDAFRASSENRKENYHRGLTPDKSKNIFAVPANSAKPARFNLDAPAGHVKSRYFHSNQSNSSSSISKTSSPQESHPTSKRSSSMSGSKKNPQQNTIAVMFKNAPVLPKHPENKTHKPEPKAETKKGMLKYFTPQDAQLPSAKESFRSLKLSSELDEENQRFDQQTVRQGMSQGTKASSSQLSVFSKFQSSFSQHGNKQGQNRASPMSAFAWSKGKFGQDLAAVTPTVSVNQNDCLEGEVQSDSNIHLTESGDANQSSVINRSSSSQNKQQIISEPESTKSGPSLSRFFNTSQRQANSKKLDSKPGGSGYETCLTASPQMAALEDDPEVKELQAYEYSDFIKTFGRGRNGSEMSDNSPDSEICEQQSPKTPALEDSNGSTDQTPDERTQETASDSDRQDVSVLSEADDKRSVSGAELSQRSNLWSIDSDCFPTSQDFIDLTDSEPDSQNSSVSSSSRLSSISRGHSACRVSGLSRSKTKQSTSKKANAVLPGQRSIKDLMNRFQYTRRGPDSNNIAQ